MANNSVEQIKDQSRQLRGTIEPTLADPASTHFTEDDYQLLKFHGTYQQDDRDLRVPRKKEGLDKAWSFMVRTKQPGGKITAAQYLALDSLASDIANGTLRITNRQGIQFHGILKVSLRDAMQRIHDSGLTTWGACGDVVRNTMGPSAPFDTAAHRAAQALAQELSDTFMARSSAYAQIWLNGEKLSLDAAGNTAAAEEIEEPIYGKHYLPRKFKIGIAIPPRNDTDIYSQDLGYIADLAPDGTVTGYHVTAGGGFGMSHGQNKTYPVLGKPMFRVAAEHAVRAAVAIVTTQRDHGDRTDRKHARLKYTIEDMGFDRFREEVLRRMDVPVQPFAPARLETVGDVLGWHEQGDGRLFLGLFVEVGRIKDEGGCNYRAAFREIAQQFGFPFRFTPNANLIFADIAPEQRDAVGAVLARHGVPLDGGLTEARRTGHSCVALPTCGLALSESERVFPGVMDQIDSVLRELGLENEPLLVRMTGCPNGCGRPYNADFGFVGRAPDKYAFYVGGSITGDRLAGLDRKVVTTAEIPAVVRPYLEAFKTGRQSSETFSAWYGRTHTVGEAPHPDQFHVELTERAARLAGQKAQAADA
jgi:sulfite reductase (ferredoxin)